MENQISEIVDSSRTTKRKQLKTLGSNVVAYIVELVTNSDDSYRRLEKLGVYQENIAKPIYIDIFETRGVTLISVVDNAEGMSSKRIKEIFSKYGGENSGGEEALSRGIFGQGATDVMLIAAIDKKQAMLESFKDNELCKFYFKWNSEKAIRQFEEKPVNYTQSQIKDLRLKYKIPENGTRMTFGVPSSVKFDKETIIDDLNGSHSLRYILNSDNRKVFLTINNQTTLLSSKKYSLEDYKLIKNREFNFLYSDIDLNCQLFLFKNVNKKQQKDYASHILVIDKNKNVYANTFFGFEKMPKSRDISGVLIIDGIYQLAKYHLNKENPDEIINEDRTGFNTRHDFYKTLTSKYLDSIINDTLYEHGAELENVDFSKNRKFKEALSEINKWFSEELKEDLGGGNQKGSSIPSDGIDLGRDSITITQGRTYTLRININSNQISETDDIFIELFGNNNNVKVANDLLNYKSEDIQDSGLVTKTITINAINPTQGLDFVVLKVSSKNYHKEATIFVVIENVHIPENGMSFESNDATFTPNGNHKSRVWFDTNVFKIGTVVLFESELNLEIKSITLSSEMIIRGTLGFFEIISRGGEIEKKYLLSATVQNFDHRFSQNIHIKNQIPNSLGSSGLITSIKGWVEEGSDFQITFEEKSGTIYINFKNAINIEMMGDLETTNPDNPKFNEKQLKYLADLLSFQSAIIDVKELERKNQIVINDQDRVDEYVNNLNKKKIEIFNRIINILN